MEITIQELEKILKKVSKQLLGKKGIKYVNVDYDNRVGDFWRVTFRHWGGKNKTTVFTNTNRLVEERRNLYEEIM